MVHLALTRPFVIIPLCPPSLVLLYSPLSRWLQRGPPSSSLLFSPDHNLQPNALTRIPQSRAHR